MSKSYIYYAPKNTTANAEPAPILRATDEQFAAFRCTLNHSGSRAVLPLQGNDYGECCGCGCFYTAGQVIDYRPLTGQ